MESVVRYLKTPHWRRQHRWRKAVWHAMSSVGLTGLHALPLSRRWVDIHRRPMPLAGLDPVFAGFRLVHISDLHFSPVVWRTYLQHYVEWVNDLKPDAVVITGDLITGGYRYAAQIADILLHIKAASGVICTFGNHDYSMWGKHLPAEAKRRGDYLEQRLERKGLVVLRNEVHRITRPGAARPLTIVGLDDEWTGSIDPGRAFAGVTADEPVICLNHNPANCVDLMQYPWQWMLSGHTHGRQVATSALGRRLYPHRYRHYTHGYYAVNGRHLYVNRGLSYGQRIQHWCRPEVTVFRLTPADDGRAD